MISCCRDSEEFREIVEWSQGLAVDALWLSVCKIYSDEGYNDRKHIFLEVLATLLLEGRVFLASGEPLVGAVAEQIAAFDLAWPAEEDIDEALFWVTKDGNSWVPGGLVWIYEDGTEIWT